LINEHLCTPYDWANIAQREAIELLGTPEGATKLAEAKRYLMCAELIKELKQQLADNLRRGDDHVQQRTPI
jgi:hypothetical protein